VISSDSTVLVIIVYTTILSKGSPLALAVICITDVKKDIGLKSPDIHKDLGKTRSDDHFSN
jgi:hypothetical protein